MPKIQSVTADEAVDLVKAAIRSVFLAEIDPPYETPDVLEVLTAETSRMTRQVAHALRQERRALRIDFS